MASREHSGVRASLPPVDDAGEAGAVGEGGFAASDGLACADPPPGHCADSDRCSGGAKAPASLLTGGLAYTRRAVLGAAVAVGISLPSMGRGRGGVTVEPATGLDAVHPVSNLTRTRPSPIKGEGSWAELLRRFQRIDLAKERFQEASSARAYGPGRRPFHEQETLDERFGVVVDAADAAMMKLLEAPAPDLEAMAVKIPLIGDHLVWEMEGGEDCLVWLEADVRRLAAAEVR
jgi:hypothetical protein